MKPMLESLRNFMPENSFLVSSGYTDLSRYCRQVVRQSDAGQSIPSVSHIQSKSLESLSCFSMYGEENSKLRAYYLHVER